MPYVEGARQLATVQVVDKVLPIEGADRIEQAHVLGWTVVVAKGAVSPGDKVVYFEIDTLLPESDPRFASFQKRGTKKVEKDGKEISGAVLKTMKLRGVFSQGLIMTFGELGLNADDFEVDDDLTDLLGVLKYEPFIPSNGEIEGHFNVDFCPKSDAERVQNLSKHWDEIVALEWVPTLKIDGTSRTIARDENGDLHIFSRNWEISDSDDGMRVAREWGLVDALQPNQAVQFELAGVGIQSNRLKLNTVRPFVFSMWDHRNKVANDAWPEPMKKAAAPHLDAEKFKPTGELGDFIDFVAKELRGFVTKDCLDEGIVFHLKDTEEPEKRWLGERKCFKVINNRYLTKHNL